jgi:hypothetical protein
MCYANAAATKTDPVDAARAQAKSVFMNARNLWLAQKPVDDSNGQAWQTWQAAEPMRGPYMNGVNPRTVPGNKPTAPGGGGIPGGRRG